MPAISEAFLDENMPNTGLMNGLPIDKHMEMEMSNNIANEKGSDSNLQCLSTRQIEITTETGKIEINVLSNKEDNHNNNYFEDKERDSGRKIKDVNKINATTEKKLINSSDPNKTLISNETKFKSFSTEINNHGETNEIKTTVAKDSTNEKEYSHLDDVFAQQLSTVNDNLEANSQSHNNENETHSKKSDNVRTVDENTNNSNEKDVEMEPFSEERTSESNQDDNIFNNQIKNKCSKSDELNDKQTNEMSDSDIEVDDDDVDMLDMMNIVMSMAVREPVVKLECVEIFNCSFCQQAFLDNAAYRRHNLQHIAVKVPITPKINTKRPANGLFIPKHQCPDCEAAFVLESTLQEHSVLHQPFPYICKCTIGFYERKDLLGHVKLVHNNNVKDWANEDLVSENENDDKENESGSDIKEEEVKKNKKEAKKKTKSKHSNKFKAEKSSEPKVIFKDDDWLLKEEIESDAESVLSNWATGKKSTKGKKTKKKSGSTKDKALHSMDNVDIKLLVPEVAMTESKSQICHVCQATMKTVKSLRAHVTGHDQRIPCDDCDKTFLLPIDLERHKQEEVPKVLEILPCPICSKTFPTLRKLKMHLNCHKNKTAVNCPVCNKVLSTKHHLKVHMRIHTGEKPYVCTLCQKAFTQQGPLKNHMEYHSGERNYKCEVCAKAFPTKGTLERHQVIHSDRTPYVCCFCDRGFKDPSAYARHERTHTNDRRYTCKQCPAAFTDASGLIAHRRRHTGIREHKCSQCDFKFYTKAELSKHEFLHTKVAAYACDICKCQFALKQYLLTHMVAMHLNPTEKVKCKVCKVKLRPSSLSAHMKSVHDVVITKPRRKYY